MSSPSVPGSFEPSLKPCSPPWSETPLSPGENRRCLSCSPSSLALTTMKWNPSLFLLLSPVVASSAPYKRFVSLSRSFILKLQNSNVGPRSHEQAGSAGALVKTNQRVTSTVATSKSHSIGQTNPSEKPDSQLSSILLQTLQEKAFSLQPQVELIF